MDDSTAQQPLATSQPNLSYVDNYAPPGTSPVPSIPDMPVTSDASMTAPTPSTTPSAIPWMPSTPLLPADDTPKLPSMSDSPMPPAMSSSPPAMPSSPPAMPSSPVPTPAADSAPNEDAAPASDGQSLEEQNIFEMLGAGEANDDEKESFLDELQQVIWEDFLENDVELLITEAEKTELKTIQDKTYPSDLEKQEAIVVFLEKLIPDLEDIMLEKALELKRDMFMERIAGMRDMSADQADKLSTISSVENLVSQDKWHEAVTSLNALA